ncbi:MAG: hypothetical protein UY77_C0040G0005 [Candidatus Uhrbacteria bacterium GW2011_GWA2_53_10]|uniref:Cell division protein FtsL n=1 Tax=Candidatus Uhrbacteria bacterium GW2011_GWA2_53_10 TaxID=1618980 RepID=A0A0G1XM29_9BACT|nr:MAG: hypothetical protein UY77_C0040G0005 [Candidatus Uhrbacteria bacterium GW2011_GWA2_53_10]
MSPFSQTMLSGVAKTRTLVATVDRHHVMLNIVSLVAVLLVCIAYVIQVNATVNTGYTIREFETKIKQVSLENQHLEADVRKVQTLENVSQAVKILGFVPSETPTYITASAPSYAVAK